MFTMKNSINTFIYLFFGSCLMLTACKKADQAAETSNLTEFIADARHFFETTVSPQRPSDPGDATTRQSNPRKYQQQWPDWAKAVAAAGPRGQGILVPLKFTSNDYIHVQGAKYAYPLEQTNKLYIYKDSLSGLQAIRLTYFPDDAFVDNPARFTGTILLENWKGEKLAVYKKEADGLYQEDPQPQVEVNSKMICIYSEGYNYSAGDPKGYYWSELIGCTFIPTTSIGVLPVAYDKFPEPELGGGIRPGGKPPLGAQPVFTVFSGKNPILNVKKYLDCFDNTPGSDNKYQVTICVSQPSPGRRDPWYPIYPWQNESNPVYTGHAWLVLSQIRPGSTTVRNIGFYPNGDVHPFKPSAPGFVNNDQDRGFDVRLTISMTSSQFFTVLEYVNQAAFWQYNLNTNNCTTFVLNALHGAGFNVPATWGTWINGGGYNPGDLGQDIREMEATTTMQPSSTTGKHPNQGYCN